MNGYTSSQYTGMGAAHKGLLHYLVSSARQEDVSEMRLCDVKYKQVQERKEVKQSVHVNACECISTLLSCDGGVWMLVQLLADSLLNHYWNALEAGLVVAEILLVQPCV